jgi:hypothetical protein
MKFSSWWQNHKAVFLKVILLYFIPLALSFKLTLFIYLGSTGIWPQGLILARQVFYHLSCSLALKLTFKWALVIFLSPETILMWHICYFLNFNLLQRYWLWNGSEVLKMSLFAVLHFYHGFYTALLSEESRVLVLASSPKGRSKMNVVKSWMSFTFYY